MRALSTYFNVVIGTASIIASEYVYLCFVEKIFPKACDLEKVKTQDTLDYTWRVYKTKNPEAVQ